MNILEFYRKCESKYEHLPIFILSKDNAEKILQDAKPGAFSQLKILFGEDEKLMFYMLEYVLSIPVSIRLHKKQAKLHRKGSRRSSQNKRRLEDKINRQVEDFVSLYRALNPDVDNEILKKSCIDCLKKDKRFRLNIEDLNNIIKNIEKQKNRQGKANAEFKDIIYTAYTMSKGKSDNIAKLLNCLNFKTPQGKPYTKKNIEHYCEPPSR
jgi:hypothetical protein